MGADLDPREYGSIAGCVSEFVAKRVDLFLVQTKRLLHTCRGRGFSQVDWHPTSRVVGQAMGYRDRCRRFVFIGQVRTSKGVKELIEAARHLPGATTVDIYGPFYDGLDSSIFQACECICYQGILEPERVLATLREYDAFVLPSKAVTEGYPGAILEALSVGMPIISTAVGGIPEIVDERCGILVEPGDTDALAGAMLRLVDDEALYHRFCQGALEVKDRFSAEYWVDWLVDQCDRLHGRHKSTKGNTVNP